MYPEVPGLRLLVEKDFPCAHPHAPEAHEPATERFAPTAAFLERKRETDGAVSTTAGRGRVARARVIAVRDGRSRERDDRLATEEPLEIRADGPGQEPVRVAVTMRTPGHDFELAAGFLVTEGLVARARWRASPTARTRGRPAVQRRHGASRAAVRPRRRRAQLLRHLELRHLRQGRPGGGRGALRAARRRRRRRRRGRLARPARARCGRPSACSTRTGGLHAAGLFDAGRRPAGAARGRRPPQRGRQGRRRARPRRAAAAARARPAGLGAAGFEIVQKAAVAGFPILCAVSAPSSLAVEAAERLGVTLVGFLRADGFNVYAHPRGGSAGTGLMARTRPRRRELWAGLSPERDRPGQAQPLRRDAARGLGEPPARCPTRRASSAGRLRRLRARRGRAARLDDRRRPPLHHPAEPAEDQHDGRARPRAAGRRRRRCAALPAPSCATLGRLAYPMVRRAGEPGFTRVSWDEALDLVAGRIRGGRPGPARPSS